MSEKARATIKKEINEDEELLWYGQPAQGFLSFPVDSYMIPFSVVWGGGAIIWELVIIFIFIKSPELKQFFLMLFGTPFMIIGLHMIFGRYILDKKQRENIFYGVTNKRIIIIQGKKHRKIASFLISKLTHITIVEKQNSRGTILFSKRQPFDSFHVRGLMPRKMFSSERFEMLDNVNDIYNKITEAQRALQQQT